MTVESMVIKKKHGIDRLNGMTQSLTDSPVNKRLDGPRASRSRIKLSPIKATDLKLDSLDSPDVMSNAHSPERNETDYQSQLQQLKAKQNREILDFLSVTDAEEKRLKIMIQEAEPASRRTELAKNYSKLSNKFQAQMSKLMERQRIELNDLVANFKKY